MNKYPEKINTKKEYWKKFVSYEDFEKIFFNKYNKHSKDLSEIQKVSDNWNKIVKDTKLQNDNKELSGKITDLQKHNTNLTEQVNKYVLLFKDEKKDKNQRIEKYENLQTLLNTKLIEFNNVKIKLSKWFFILLWISFMLVLIVLWFIVLWLYRK